MLDLPHCILCLKPIPEQEKIYFEPCHCAVMDMECLELYWSYNKNTCPGCGECVVSFWTIKETKDEAGKTTVIFVEHFYPE